MTNQEKQTLSRFFFHLRPTTQEVLYETLLQEAECHKNDTTFNQGIYFAECAALCRDAIDELDVMEKSKPWAKKVVAEFCIG